MLRTNKDLVVKLSILVEVAHPVTRMPVVDSYGKVYYVPGVGGITYNFGLGDNAFSMHGDHIEPDISAKNSNKDLNPTCMALACIGNEAVVISGDGKGMRGYVIGKHGGIDHVLIWMPEKDKLAIGDKIQIKAWGQGLELLDYPDVRLMNIDPELFEKIPIVEHNGKLEVPVAAIVPAHLTGSGIGASNPAGTDYDMNTMDMDEIRKYGLDKVRIGDLVAIKDHYNSHGAGGYKVGAMSIGVVVHSNCYKTGHGPGMVVIMSSVEGKIVPRIDENSNIKNYLGI
ncbi:DUF4438 domain-containing protein [Fervidobacterium thailandense]|uniref:DUF4438 domain-containing protein n=1 Tax=Fervidobacterium thailandense TaxID=1008305 RepID=A0A1E3G1H0_9BACT|nr:DUF4438 domain-containing protein [Fervidobacterium thailandense]ODN29713.1 hypothetical protein A4H02_09245 [Fervidobacterium thailandense]